MASTIVLFVVSLLLYVGVRKVVYSIMVEVLDDEYPVLFWWLSWVAALPVSAAIAGVAGVVMFGLYAFYLWAAS